MKIYTKTGDKGGTSLLGGQRVHKDDIRISAYGTVDELNSHIGLLISYVENDTMDEILAKIQSKLFDIGSHMASEDPNHPALPALDYTIVSDLEHAIDSMESELEPLKTFILPGGSVSASQCHVCRTVCRRAERRVVTLARNEDRYELIVQFLNRLSDYLFVFARWLCKQDGVKEVPWVASK